MSKYNKDKLKHLAEHYYDDDRQNFMKIASLEISKVFWEQVKQYIKDGTLMVFNSNGNVTDGKSTFNLEIARRINLFMGNKIDISYILGDQIDYIKWIRDNPKKSNLMIAIDEWNDLGQSGENVTVDNNLLSTASNVHAQAYVHRLTASPKEFPDKNAFIQFEVASTNKKTMTTQCYVYYVIFRAGGTFPQIIGHINLDVSKTLKSVWYKKYRELKFYNIKLLRENGILNKRDLWYAPIFKRIIEKFSSRAKSKRITESRIMATMKKEFTRRGIGLSILGKHELAMEPKQVLDNYYDLSKCLNEIEQLKREKFSGYNHEKIKELLETKHEYEEDIKDDLVFLDTKISLLAELESINFQIRNENKSLRELRNRSR